MSKHIIALIPERIEEGSGKIGTPHTRLEHAIVEQIDVDFDAEKATYNYWCRKSQLCRTTKKDK